MEDAHAAVLDLQPEDNGKPKPPDERLAFFGVYDGHGGDKVALFAGKNVHRIIAKQDSFKKGDMEQALKDGFLATDRAILNSWSRVSVMFWPTITDMYSRSRLRGGSLWVYSFSFYRFEKQDLGGTLSWKTTAGIIY
jgi:hypothetical protein